MKKYKIGEVLSISSLSIIPQTGTTYQLYSLPSFDDGKVPEVVRGEMIQSNKYVVPNRCILFNKLNVRFKRIWRINNNKPNKLCSTEFLPLAIDESIIDYQYCYYLLVSDYLTNYLCGINSNTSGSHKRINPDILLSVDVALPPLNEQKRIGSILANLDRKIALNRAINHNLETMAKQLYDYWFVQFDFPDENGKPYKSSGGKMVWNEKLKREIPQGWNGVILNDFLIIKNGRDHKLLATGNYPVYGSGGEMRRVSAYLYNGEAILMPRKGSLNNIMYVNRAFWTVDTMFYSEMKIPHCAKYVFFSIKDIDFTRWDSGTGVPSMTASLLYSIPIVKPNDTILQTFDNILLPIFKKLEKVQLENESLTKLRDELLPLLMNGQVSVNYDLSHD